MKFRDTTIIQVNNVGELDKRLKILGAKTRINIMSYHWTEYGFLPVRFNDCYRDFYEHIANDNLPFIGICFEGQEIFYENKVDTLIVLNNFIDTRRAYQNDKETPLFIKNLKLNQDRGAAFVKTILNFNHLHCEQVIKKSNWENLIYPDILRITKHKTFGTQKHFLYGVGRNGKQFIANKNKYVRDWFGWNKQIQKEILDTTNLTLAINLPKKFDTLICKNSWKTRNFRSNNLQDFVGGRDDQKGYVGFIGKQFVSDLCKEYVEKKRYLVIINDLIKFKLPKDIQDSQYIVEVNMIGHLDVRKWITIANSSDKVYLPPTAALDIILYYCKVNLAILVHNQHKCRFKTAWIDSEQNLNNKTYEHIQV